MPIIESAKPKNEGAPSSRLKSLAMYMEPGKKEDFLQAVSLVEKLEKHGAFIQDRVDELEMLLEEERDADAQLVQNMQASLEQQRLISQTERRVFLLTVAKVKGWKLSPKEAAELSDF